MVKSVTRPKEVLSRQQASAIAEGIDRQLDEVVGMFPPNAPENYLAYLRLTRTLRTSLDLIQAQLRNPNTMRATTG